MLMPKRVKRRKQHRGRMKGIATKGNAVAYGSYGLMADGRGWIDSKQIEAARVAMTRSIKRGGKVYIKIFPHKPVSKKPVMFEIDGVTEEQAREAMRLAAHKLPIKCKFVVKGQEGGAQ